MNVREFCQDDTRRQDVRARPGLNGLDYLEVSEDQLTLTVFFLGRVPAELLRQPGEEAARYQKRLVNSVRIEGGQRITDVRVIDVDIQQAVDPRTGRIEPDMDDRMRVRLDRYGDFSAYTLRLTGVERLDPFYDHLDFTFKAGCPSDLDCRPVDLCPPAVLPEPEISYLARDYASLRQLILDRLALIMPDWRERHVPDLGIALVEVLAYVGDYLSYYQDAVATEAYLDTARQRMSVRRHARLVDYYLHEGCNARAWVCVETDTDLAGRSALNPKDVYFVTGISQERPAGSRILNANELRQAATVPYEVFEPVTSQPIELYSAHNEICFYAWANRDCCLPRGATSATLKDRCTDVLPAPQAPAGGKKSRRRYAQQPPDAPLPPSPPAGRAMQLSAGDVLIFEEVKGPKTGDPNDADPTHRHAVRLTNVSYGQDTLYDPPAPIVEIEWAAEDALPFPFCLSALGPAPECTYIEDISIARGNVVLVDHGYTEPPEDLGVVPCERVKVECECEGHPGEASFVAGRYRPRLARAPLTHRVPFPSPGAVAEQQARRLVTVMDSVYDRLRALLRQVQQGETLTEQELAELEVIWGSRAMNEAGPLGPSGKEWPAMSSAEQAAGLQHLLDNEDRWLKNKARRVALLQARAQQGLVLNGAAREVTEMFGAQHAAALDAGSSYALGPASMALVQDARQALPQIWLHSIPAAPATSCRELHPLFGLKDTLDSANLAARLHSESDAASRVLRTRFSKETQQLVGQRDASGTAAVLDKALNKELAQWQQAWAVQPELLNSQPDDPHYVVEIDNDGRAWLRFGNGESGRSPQAGASFWATYRVGNGPAGNVGAETIVHLVLRQGSISGVSLTVRNPLPAVGGTEPEPMAEAKLFAPAAFRTELQRAITPDDYAHLSQHHFPDMVQRAAGRLNWTGSWYEAQVSIDPFHTANPLPPLLSRIERRLQHYRRIGHDLAVLPARQVPLRVEMTVCVLPHYLRGHVEAELRRVLGSRQLPGGRRGFFHPDNLTFGEGIYLSSLVAAVQAVQGVESVAVTVLQRLDEGDQGELAAGVVGLGPLEIARLDSDPSFPEHGRLVLKMEGGR